MMGIFTFMVERSYKNKRWIKKTETSLAEINPLLIMSWLVSLSLVLRVSSNLSGVFTWTLVEVLLILFEKWEVGLLIFDEPPFTCLTPTDFISKFTDLLTPSFMSKLALFRLLLYPIVLWVFRRRFEGMSQVPCETER